MDIFHFRGQLISDYAGYVKSFIRIGDQRIDAVVREELDNGALWPQPLVQLNPFFKPGATVDELIRAGILHATCREVFRRNKSEADPDGIPMHFHTHQEEAIRVARGGGNYVLTTGTGSGKSLSYIVPIVDHVLRNGSGKGIKAIVVYPMNALANSQANELKKFLGYGFGEGLQPVRYARYTGQETQDERDEIIANPPDILLTNYVMLELILTRANEGRLINQARDLRFLVLDELHTYRGRQGADVAMLIRRVRERTHATQLQCIGTSATMASGGTLDEQRSEVARVATRLFGAVVPPANVIGETLKRATDVVDHSDPAFKEALVERVTAIERHMPRTFAEFSGDPLAIWIESKIGVREDPLTGRLVRATPRSLTGPGSLSGDLATETGLSLDQCVVALQKTLSAGYACEPDPVTGMRPFAFRLHQFISRGDSVYASLEAPETRYITLQGQRFVPADRTRLLYPVVFCRECGQEHYSVWMRDTGNGQIFLPRAAREDEPEGPGWEPGYLHVNEARPWPDDDAEAIAQSRYPDDWLEPHPKTGELRVKTSRRADRPMTVTVRPDGSTGPGGIRAQFVPSPFKFCLNCTVSYSARAKSDFAKLASLSSEGRSTATTILSLSAIRHLRGSDLSPTAHKLLAFSDDRQDASLQAGHFNDFVENGLLRAALFRALSEAGPDGIDHDVLADRVFRALRLPHEAYANNANSLSLMQKTIDAALKNVLGYRLYRDLRRGWRITAPNLEQCGLLEIQYEPLDAMCVQEDRWSGAHPALAQAQPQVRAQVCKVLLDHMRRELAIKVEYLSRDEQERIKRQSFQHLIPPWAIDENELLETAPVLYPKSNDSETDSGRSVFLSSRGGFGQYLRRMGTFPGTKSPLKSSDSADIIRDLLTVMSTAGLLEMVEKGKDGVPGYQLLAAAMRWVAGDGTRAYRDLISVPNQPEQGGAVNTFFVELYRSAADSLVSIEAREHTAQVPALSREDREKQFRAGKLPVLYCSPTMELGVDISDLNVVGMRNMPPTPANYAQRSGRAGRSGQPAIVFTYCSTGNSHDQYFFKRPSLMVSGSVTAPRLDLANESLIRAHMHAIWLGESGLRLDNSLANILDTSGDTPTLEVAASIKDALNDVGYRARARASAARVLESLHDELSRSPWYTERWLDDVLNRLPQSFEDACARWRELYRAAHAQAAQQNRIVIDASRKPQDRKTAERLRAEAESQLKLLTDIDNAAQSDFYSYRYFASEGFLPGYSFPRLPVSAFIQARRSKQRDEFLSRPRFLAISEFGPRALIYHEGSTYQIAKVIMPMRAAVEGESQLDTSRIKRCDACGYVHPVTVGDGDDKCGRCGATLPNEMRALLRMQNVATRRRDRISSDEEERRRTGYEVITGVRWGEHGEQNAIRSAEVLHAGQQLARLTLGDGAQLWRINLGERRRANKDQRGFVLDVEKGYWQANSKEDQHNDDDDAVSSGRTLRVIPYVSDQRNCLIYTPEFPPGWSLDQRNAWMASMQSALKRAIQAVYQLEESELAAEPLPDRDNRREILLYESAEGGAGVLRRLFDDANALGAIARKALEICHFDADSGADRRHADGAKEVCEAACYDCLLSYYNQRDHAMLDRKQILDGLVALRDAELNVSPSEAPRSEHLGALLAQCASSLERDWLAYLNAHNLALPSHAQRLIEQCGTRPDFWYAHANVAIYIDGPHHDYPERRVRDMAQQSCLDDLGLEVIRFGHRDDWGAIIGRHPSVFGTPS